jgi:glycosyltransferase involved in cell wall biosynthesis
MKLLFLLDMVYSGESANIRLAKLLAGRLAAAGEQVHFLVNCLPDQQTAFAGFEASFFTCTADKVSYEAVQRARQTGKGAAGQALALLKKPAAALNLASTVLRKKSLAEAPWRREIEKACTVPGGYDAVVSVSCPHYLMFALGDAQIAAKKICYMLDPYWSNVSMPYAVSIKREQRLYEAIDGAFVTDLMAAENENTCLAPYRGKMHVLPFPGLEEKKDGRRAATILLTGNIQMVYIGNLYPSVRSPEGLFRLMEKLPQQVGLTIFGGGREGFDKKYFPAWQEKLGSRLALHTPVDAKTASDLLLHGDILVNLGNTVANQLPSKVFEYLSTGRPVLNLYALDACPTLPYFARYPLACSIKAGDLSTETIQNVENFCLAAKGKALPFAQVESLFSENTPQAVAERFLRVTKEIIEA